MGLLNLTLIGLWLMFITLFRYITMFCGTLNIPQNVPPHLDWLRGISGNVEYCETCITLSRFTLIHVLYKLMNC